MAFYFAILALNQQVFAQDPEPVVEKITVTARKKEVDLQDAPVSVTAVSGEDFKQANLVKLDNLNGFVPGLVVSKNDGAGRVVAIRGIGWETAQNLSTQPSVLVYLDGVYLANPLALGLDLGDIDRIEVLRGPQGTEFGQGTTGGAINIITKQSDFNVFGGGLEFSAGSFGLLGASGRVNVPINNQWVASASVEKRDRDGFAEIRGGTLDGYDLDDQDGLTGHFSLQGVPNDRLSIRLSGFWHDADHHGAAQKHVNDPNPHPRELTQDYPSSFSLFNRSLSAVVSWESPWGFTLKSLTGFQKLEKAQSLDGDRLTESLTAIDLTGFGPSNFDILTYWDNDSDAFSQEINLTGKSGRLDWIFGIYALDHENFNDFLEAAGPAPISQFQDRLDNPSPETLPPFTAPLSFVETRTLEREDRAVFAQGTYHLNERLALTFGARFQTDKSTDRATQFWFNSSEQVLEDDALTWKLGADVKLSDDNLLYALVATGWKNGGNNPGALVGGALDVPVNFRPEEVTAFELGSKNRLWNDRVRFNAVGFYYDYNDYQFIQEDPVPFSGGTGNLPSVEIYGLETEFSWRLDKHWRLDGHMAAMDGTILDDIETLDVVDFLNSGFGRFTPTGVADRASLRVNLAGNQIPKLADLTYRIMVTYTREVGRGSNFTARLDTKYRGDFQYRVFNHPQVDRVPAYHTTGLFFGYHFGPMPLELSLSATNLFDEDGVNSRFSNPFGLHTTSQEFIPPRQVVASIRYTF